MFPNDLTRFLQRIPFQPFRLYILERTAYEVRHPETAIVGPSTVTLYLPQFEVGPVLVDQEVVIALQHVTRLEPLPPKSTGNGNPA